MAEQAGEHRTGISLKGDEMSDLRPVATEIELGGQKRNLLFTINAIDEIQEKCNMPLFDAVRYVAGAADGKTDRETLSVFRSVLTVLLNDGEQKYSEEEAGRFVTLANYKQTAWKVLEAYGISIPDPDEMDEDEDEDGDPKAETGQ